MNFSHYHAFHCPILLHWEFLIVMMLGSSSEAWMVCARVESRPRERTWALADHVYAAAPRHAPSTKGRKAIKVDSSCHAADNAATYEASSSGNWYVSICRRGKQQRRLFSHARLSKILVSSRCELLDRQLDHWTRFCRGCRRIARIRREALIVSAPSPAAKQKENSDEHSWWSTSDQPRTSRASFFSGRTCESPWNRHPRRSRLSTPDSSSEWAWTCNIDTCARSLLQPATSPHGRAAEWLPDQAGTKSAWGAGLDAERQLPRNRESFRSGQHWVRFASCGSQCPN